MRIFSQTALRLGFVGLLVLLSTPAGAGVRGSHCLYLGGTIAGLKQHTMGSLDLSHTRHLIFHAKQLSFSIAYDRIETIEYGQKVGRRLAAAISLTPLALLSKKRRHFLTLGFTDRHGHSEGAIFELSKGEVDTTLVILQARTGRRVEYQSAEAEAHVHG